MAGVTKFLRLHRSRTVSSVSVLIIDDFEIWKNFVTTFLGNRPGLHVAGFASDGLEAIQKAEELQPDLILLDVSLPKLNGIQAAQKIRKIVPHVRILFLSCHADTDTVRAAFCAGGQGFILKWDAAAALWPGIEAILSGKQFLSDSLGKLDDLIDTAT
jgi:DNA-binding NarL/FixJ family response regulator